MRRDRTSERFPVTIAAGSHPFPSRTRKLSLPAPMVLGGRPPGRVGRRRNWTSDDAHLVLRVGIVAYRFRLLRNLNVDRYFDEGRPGSSPGLAVSGGSSSRVMQTLYGLTV